MRTCPCPGGHITGKRIPQTVWTESENDVSGAERKRDKERRREEKRREEITIKDQCNAVRCGAVRCAVRCSAEKISEREDDW